MFKKIKNVQVSSFNERELSFINDQRLNAKISDTIRGHLCYKENVIGLTSGRNMDQSISDDCNKHM